MGAASSRWAGLRTGPSAGQAVAWRAGETKRSVAQGAGRVAASSGKDEAGRSRGFADAPPVRASGCSAPRAAGGVRRTLRLSFARFRSQRVPCGRARAWLRVASRDALKARLEGVAGGAVGIGGVCAGAGLEDAVQLFAADDDAVARIARGVCAGIRPRAFVCPPGCGGARVRDGRCGDGRRSSGAALRVRSRLRSRSGAGTCACIRARVRTPRRFELATLARRRISPLSRAHTYLSRA